MPSSVSLYVSVHFAYHCLEYSDVKVVTCILKSMHKTRWSESFHSLYCFFCRREVTTWTMWAVSRKYISSFAERAQSKSCKPLPSLYRRTGYRKSVVSAVSSPTHSTVNSIQGKISETDQVPVVYEVMRYINACMMDWCSKNLFCAIRNSAWKWRVEGDYVFRRMDFETSLATAITPFIPSPPWEV